MLNVEFGIVTREPGTDNREPGTVFFTLDQVMVLWGRTHLTRVWVRCIRPPDPDGSRRLIAEAKPSPRILAFILQKRLYPLEADGPPPMTVRNPLREVQASPDSDAERELRPRRRCARGITVPGNFTRIPKTVA